MSVTMTCAILKNYIYIYFTVTHLKLKLICQVLLNLATEKPFHYIEDLTDISSWTTDFNTKAIYI